MSYWVYLEDRSAEPTCSYVDKQPRDDYERQWGACSTPCYPSVQVERHTEGGTYAVGGSSEASLNVTYNYSKQLRRGWEVAGGSFDGEGDGSLGDMLGGKRAADVLPYLEGAVEALGTERASDYWASTDGNAGAALAILLGWARQHPDAVFRVS